MENGDRIEIDIPNRRIHLAISDAELTARRTAMEAQRRQGLAAGKPRTRRLSGAAGLRSDGNFRGQGAVRDVRDSAENEPRHLARVSRRGGCHRRLARQSVASMSSGALRLSVDPGADRRPAVRAAGATGDCRHRPRRRQRPRRSSISSSWPAPPHLICLVSRSA